MRLLATLAALTGLLGVAFAAVGAHVIHDPVAAGHAASAATLQMVHALAALLALTMLPRRTGRAIAVMFIAGAALFAIGVDVHALGGPSLGPVAPIGGTLLMLGWAGLAVVFATRGPHA